MKRFFFFLIFIFSSFVAVSAARAADVLTGTVTLPAGAVLPPGALIEVELLDDFAADAPNVIAHTEMPASVGRPSTFSLKLDPQRLQGNHPYSATAYVRSPQGLLYTVTKKYPVFTQGGGGKADIVLVAAPAVADKPFGPALEDTYWRLSSVGGVAAPASASREPYLRLYAFSYNASASGGCNILRGTYAVKDQAISFVDLASTRMACPNASNVDDALLKALTAARKANVTGERMDLLDANGSVLASFQGIPPR